MPNKFGTSSDHNVVPTRETRFWRLAEDKFELWLDMPLDYTCGCGLPVHPLNLNTNPYALHIPDCEYYL